MRLNGCMGTGSVHSIHLWWAVRAACLLGQDYDDAVAGSLLNHLELAAPLSLKDIMTASSGNMTFQTT